MRVDRKKIHQLFGGKCAYCGCDLKDETGKYMHIDHVEPIIRNWFINTPLRPEKDNELNMFPSCPQCNRYKSYMPLELFRENIRLSNQRLKVYAAYNNAIRFGLVKEIEWGGLFWFEKFGKS